MPTAAEATTVHQTDLCAKHIGKRISGTTGTIDFEGALEGIQHLADEELRSWQDIKVRTRTTVTVSGHEFLLARGSQVTVR
jgi:hypothetical protein